MEISTEHDANLQLRLSQEIAELSVKWLQPAVLVSLGMAVLLALISQTSFRNPFVIAWLAATVVVISSRLWVNSALVRDFADDRSDDLCRKKIETTALIAAITDGMLWMANGWLFLANGFLDFDLYAALSVAAAAAFALFYLFNVRAATTAVVSILASTLLLAPFYGAHAFYEPLIFAAAFSLSLGISIFKLRGTIISGLQARIDSEHAVQCANEANFVFTQHWQNTPLAAIEWDKKFRICSWNPSAQTIFGYSTQEALGQPLEMIFRGEDLDKTKKKWRALWRNKKGFRSIHTCYNKAGEPVNCEWHDAAIMRNGQAIGIASFVEDITSQMQAELIIKKQANYDSLTGLPNRRQMMQEIGKAISRSKRSREYAALVFLDLDHFKDINDTQGHDVGDIVLKEFAGKVSGLVRDEDMVARFGGDEFVVLFENLGLSQAEAAKNVNSIARKILHAGQSLCRVGDIEYDLDVSGGIVLFDGGWQENDILKKADLAMYRVKNEGRKGISFYDDSLTIEAEYRVELIRGLRRGLENREFDLHFQPILDGAGDIVYAEALLRWIRPPNKVIPAGSFIDILANSPMMNSVGYWIIDRVCQGINKMMKMDLWDATRAIFVNISPRQLMDAGFTTKVLEILQENNIEPSLIVFEITEDSLIQNYEEVLGQLQELMAAGIRVALDDFGTGYSSLAMLKNLPVHFVKLDREFINSLLDTENNYQIVNAIIKLCEVLSLKVIAEGIEEQNQFAALKRLNCDYFQGYMFHKPMPLAELINRLAHANPAEFGGKTRVEHLRVV